MHAYQIRLHVWKGSNHLPGGEGYFRDGMRSKKRAVCLGAERRQRKLLCLGLFRSAEAWKPHGVEAEREIDDFYHDDARGLASHAFLLRSFLVKTALFSLPVPSSPFYSMYNKHRTGRTNSITIEALIGHRCVNYDRLFRRCYRCKNVCTSRTMFSFHIFYIFEDIM